MISFAWPLAFLLLPLPLLIGRWKRARTETGETIRVPPALAEALDGLERKRNARPALANLPLSLAWICLVIALAQPRILTGDEVRPASGRALELAIDLSGSMERRDFTLDGERQDRLTVVKAVAEDFLNKRSGDRIGLVLFGDEAFSAVPITFDLDAVAHAVAEAGIGMAGRTTAIGDAIGIATVKLRDDPAASKAIVLLTDGTNNSGASEPEDAAELAARFGIRVHAIAMGSAQADGAGNPIDPSADLDEETLKQVAEKSGGRFFRATTTAELEAVYAEIDTLEKAETQSPPVAQSLDPRNWLILAMLVLLVTQALMEQRRAMS